MGDEHQSRRPPALILDTDPDRRETTPNLPVPVTAPTSSHQPAMEFESYPAHQFGAGMYPTTTPFNMSAMTGSLPDYQMRNYGQQPFQQQLPLQTGQNPAMLYQLQQGAQFAGQTATFNPSFAQNYPSQFQHGQQYRTSPMSYPQFQNTPPNNPQGFQGQQFYSQQPMMQQPSFQPQNQSFLQSPGSHYGPPTIIRVGSGFQPSELHLDSNVGSSGLPYPQYIHRNLSRHSSDSSLRPSVPRGPPRKPKQSGHALWVGNLPPGTNVVDLKDHFSKDATGDIESVFLISKSNCAFVNYKTEPSCAAAMARFHDSRFQGVRLVCRLRRGSTPTSATAPAGTSAEAPEVVVSEPVASASDDPEVEVKSAEIKPAEEAPIEKVKEKYFIVKSLTMEDLDLSARNGIWATQAHNEVALNKAYQTAENVYLIFSANKSGEYFGYARMASAINDDAAATLEVPIRQEVSEPLPADLPVTIPTPATSTAPKGRIIDDSARGTIFWEADPEPESEEVKTEDAGNTSGEGEDIGAHSPANTQTFGKPFKITWISTEKLPFYRTRGLRNPWNANREVKIARDGTELEPSVGRRLTSMFHRPQMQSTSPAAARGQMNIIGGTGYFPSQQHPQQQGQYQPRPY